MIKYFYKTLTLLLVAFAFLTTVLRVQAQSNCITGCNSNTFVNSSDPNTIEYDNLISIFHSTIAKEKDGTYKVWGQGSASNGTSDLTALTAITSANGFIYTGTILRAAAASNFPNQQFAILTTTGLYLWGSQGTLVANGIPSGTSFGAVSIGTVGIANGTNSSYAKGLPNGVNPTDVKMLFGSYGTLALVTCTGDAWVLSFNGSKNGDGDSTNNVWHRVYKSTTTDGATKGGTLDNVVAIRGTSHALFALTSTGKLYTWGQETYINSGAAANRTYATEVSLPASTTPKMIGMTKSSSTGSGETYYLLATDGKLYSMGDNTNYQLGFNTPSASNTWLQVTATSGTNSIGANVVWISPNEHSNFANTAAINILTNNNKQWGWGSNSGNMIGGVISGSYYMPIFMPGNSSASDGLSLTDEVIAVETGGHTTLNVKKCSQYFGYLGHKTNGSMGDAGSGNPNTFTYSTSILIVCGTDLGPKVQSIKICPGTTVNLNTASLDPVPTDVEWHATNDASSPVLTNISAVGPGTYYAFYTVASGKCRIVGSVVYVSYYAAGDPNCICFNTPSLTGTGTDTKVGITLLKRAGAQNADNWPMVRKSGHIALESNTQGLVVTRMTTAQLDAIKTANNAVEGMMSYDTDAKCLKIYDGTDWKCFNTPSCP
jgi:hypothetical protein